MKAEELRKKMIADLIRCIDVMTIKAKEGGFVVANKDYVNVGKKRGINDTEFAPKCPSTSADAVVFKNEEEAENKGMDYYLVDGDRKPIYLSIIEASTFFEQQLVIAKEMLTRFENQ